MSKIKKGDKVKVEYYEISNDNSKKNTQIVQFVIGSGKVISNFEEAIIGMAKGQEKQMIIEPLDAYGDYNPIYVKDIPKEKLQFEETLRLGMMIALITPDGRQVPSRITKIDNEKVTIDLNHPLAGKTLNFGVRILDIL